MILTFANSKGGTAKSTSAAALAQAATYKGMTALVVDADPQGNASHILGADTSRAGLFEVLEGHATAQEAIQPTRTGPDAIAASWQLQEITTSRGSAWRLKRALEPIRDKYDFIIIDTQPAPGELQNNALAAAENLIIPLNADMLNLSGLFQIADTAQDFQGLTIRGYILTRHSARSVLHRQMTETIATEAAARNIPFLGAIRQGVAIQEAQTLQQSLFQYAPRSNPAQDYLTLFDKITK